MSTEKETPSSNDMLKGASDTNVFRQEIDQLRARVTLLELRSTCPKGHTEGDCSSTCFSEEPTRELSANLQRLLELRNAALDAWEARFPKYVWRVAEGKVDLRIRPAVEPRETTTKLEELLRDVAANGKRNWSIAAHRQLVHMGLVGSPEEPHETTVSLATYESAVKGRSDFRQAYRQARSLLRQFMAAWEGQPNHENMDRLCEAAREIAGSSEEPSADGLTEVRDRTANVALTCGGACRYHNSVFVADPECGIHFCPKCNQSMPGCSALHTDYCPENGSEEQT